MCYVNITQTIIREGAKAANIWNNPPPIKDLSPNEAKKFYDTVRMKTSHKNISNVRYYIMLQVFTLCPQLRTARHLLTIKLSRTLINCRQYLRRTQKLTPNVKSRNLKSIEQVVCDQHRKSADNILGTSNTE